MFYDQVHRALPDQVRLPASLHAPIVRLLEFARRRTAQAHENPEVPARAPELRNALLYPFWRD